ncbi:MAG: hypothetical protein K9K65_07995 [Desulfarculaceae bacterium]|nr:hypothetical protein [Desulfarculaceae bacterium]MCF8097768.1 hypothetical protein [Desulfarculaceae bacterium]MCF8123668.1 hypothetical protein [Desulfarculaceae bacterium]
MSIEYLLAESVVSLIKNWVQLRKTATEAEQKTQEWRTLEQAYMEHLKWRFEYPKKVFGQQIITGWLLTGLVIGLVICGVIFSYFQLSEAIRLGDITGLKTDITVQTAGKLSMSSSIVGAVVLVISLVFFYLYLKHVFEIRHLIPPHIGLSDTDASELWQELKVKFDKNKESSDGAKDGKQGTEEREK